MQFLKHAFIWYHSNCLKHVISIVWNIESSNLYLGQIIKSHSVSLKNDTFIHSFIHSFIKKNIAVNMNS